MAQERIVATATRKVAASREAILAFELNPRNASRLEPRVTVSDVETDPDGRPKAWTFSMKVAKVFRYTARAMFMAVDPVIVELRSSTQVQVSTATVSAEPDQDGRFSLTYTVEMTPNRGRLLRKQRERLQRVAERDINRQIDAAVALIEANSLAA